MDRAIQVTKAVALFALYTWLCREFYSFNAIDSCFDGGGAYDTAARACSDPPFGQNWDLGLRATYWFWVALLGGPALVIYAIEKVVSAAIARIRRQPPNNALERTREE